ncbi:MAG: cupin domain-containing protein [Actinobacteria bacterium]|nr:cupin domain-containing protein [Actinomycetota bacterium]
MDQIFNEEDIIKKVFGDRWVKFAFGPGGIINTDNLNMGITEFSEGKTSLTHRHDVDEALYIITGKGSIRIGDRVHNIRAGDFIHIPRESDHTIITGPESKLKIFFVFGGTVRIDY